MSTKVATLIGSDKGGVGKSFISSLIVLANSSGDNQIRVAEIDHEARLGQMFPGRVNLSLTPSGSVSALMNNSRARAERHYNDLYEEIWSQGHSLTDLGANVTTTLFDWIGACDIVRLAADDDIFFQFVTIATPDPQSILSATNALKLAVKTFGLRARYFAILNDISGESFENYLSSPAYQTILKMQDSIGLNCLEIPYCDSQIFAQGKALNLSPVTVMERAGEIAQNMGLRRVAAETEKRRLQAWLFSVQKSIYPLITSVRDVVESKTLQAAE